MKPTDFLSPQTEEKIAAGIVTMERFIEDGQSPTAALTKVAMRDAWGPEVIRLVGRSYNTGAQEHQRENAKTALDKFASFELADPEAAIAELFKPDSSVKLASVEPVTEYTLSDFADRAAAAMSRQDVEEKEAADESQPADDEELSDEFISGNKLAEISNAARRNCELYQRKIAVLNQGEYQFEREFFKSADAISHHFSLMQNRGSFGEFEAACVGVEKAAEVLDYVYSINQLQTLGEKRASATTLGNVNRYQPLVNHVKEASESLAALKVIREKLAEAEAKLSEFQRVAEHPGSTMKEASSAFGLNFLNLSRSAASLGGLGEGAGKSTAPSTAESYFAGVDPAQQDELRKIRTQRVLAELMRDDEIISGFPADHVLRRFNEISQLAPTTTDKPLALRATLRRHLIEDAAPFEAKELAEMDQQINKQLTPSA